MPVPFQTRNRSCHGSTKHWAYARSVNNMAASVDWGPVAWQKLKMKIETAKDT